MEAMAESTEEAVLAAVVDAQSKYCVNILM